MCCLNTTYDGRLPAGVDSAGEAISGQKFLPVGDPARALKELHSRHAILIDPRNDTAPIERVPRRALPTSKRTQSSELLVHDFVEIVGMFSSPSTNCSLHRSAIVSSIFFCVRNGVASENSANHHLRQPQ
jgi:hypothetical protein